MLVEKLENYSEVSNFVTLRVLSLVLVVGIFSALPACTRPDAEDDRSISAVASKIAFDGEPLGLTYRWTVEATLDTGWAELPAEVQHWSAGDARLLIFGVPEVSGTWMAEKLLPVRQTLVDMRAASEEFSTDEDFLTGRIAWGASGDLYTKLDRGKYLKFIRDDEYCFAASMLYEDTMSLSASDNFVLFIFCQSQDISDKLLLSIGLRVGFDGTKGSDDAATSAGAGLPQGKNAAASGTMRVPLMMIWRDRSERVAGAFTIDGAQNNGMLEATIFGTSDKCSGSWQWVSGAYGAADPPKGTWSVVCTDGRAASGTYRSDRPAAGDGRGTDSDGHPVIIAFGQGDR